MFERAGFLEQVRRAGNDFEPHRPVHLLHRFSIQLDDRFVASADDEQRGCHHAPERRSCEIGPAAARHNRGECLGPIRGGEQRCATAGARAEEPD